VIRVTCALIVQDGRVLAAQRSASMSHSLKWEFPGGKIEEGEDTRICIEREILEELEVVIEVLDEGPAVIYPANNPRIELTPFVAKITSGKLHAVEHADLKWCNTSELEELDWAEADLEILAWWKTIAEQFI